MNSRKIVYILITESGCMSSTDSKCEDLRDFRGAAVLSTPRVTRMFATAFGKSGVFPNPSKALEAADPEGRAKIVQLIHLSLNPAALQASC